MVKQNQPQQAQNQYGTSQYRPQSVQNNLGQAGSSQYGQNNNYYQASSLQGGGVNQYGAQYSSGHRDDEIGNAYYQGQNGTGIQSQYRGNQYTGGNQNAGNQYSGQYTGSATLNTLNNVRSNQFTNQSPGNQYNQPSALQSGVNQYGAHYSSGHRDDEIGNAYYQGQTGTGIQSQYRGNQYTGGNQNAGNQYSGQYTGSATLNTLNNVRSNQFTNQSPGNQYNQPSALQSGVNQYGAHYSSGNQDEDISKSYYNRSSQ